jgi:TrmH family RNA methyltransferase
LLTQSQRDSVDIVLVSPRNPLNIGAVARAMANFGFSRLAVVAPYAPHWREARSAIGAPDLLQNAKCTECLADAVAECTFVAGTGTVASRKPEQAVLSLPDAGPILSRHLDRPDRIALVFGPEKHGLTSDDLSFCNVLIEIPTDPRQPSMNLGQAAAVCLYELACRPQTISSAPWTVGDCNRPPFRQEKSERMGHGTSEVVPASSSGMLDRLAGLIEEAMTAAGYSPRVMASANRHDLRLLLRRLAPSGRDTRRMLGLFRRILYRLNRSADPRGS